MRTLIIAILLMCKMAHADEQSRRSTYADYLERKWHEANGKSRNGMYEYIDVLEADESAFAPALFFITADCNNKYLTQKLQEFKTTDNLNFLLDMGFNYLSCRKLKSSRILNLSLKP